jgi:hypothetical protein
MRTEDPLKLMTRKLIAIQRKLKYSDQQMADVMETSRSYWNQVRLGKKNLGATAVMHALTVFPALELFKDGKDREMEITIRVE